jgi:hypothetical protein
MQSDKAEVIHEEEKIITAEMEELIMIITADSQANRWALCTSL